LFIIFNSISFLVEDFVKKIGMKALNDVTKDEVTVAQKLNQGTIPKTGCYRFRVCFFGSFLHKQKRTNKK